MNETEADKPQPRPDEGMPDPDASAQDASAPSASVASPGEMLREAREARGLSQAELAEAAKLPQATVFSLEGDDFEVLNEPVYVRGYYRKCALTLEMDVDAMVGAYERKARPAAPALPDKIPVVAGGGSSLLRRLLRSIVFILLIGLLAAAGWWLLQPPVGGNGATGNLSFLDGAGSDEATETNGIRDTAQETNQSALANATGSAAATSDATSEAASQTTSRMQSGTDAASEDSAARSADPESGAADADAAQATGSEAVGAVLALRFEEASWLRVRDGADRTLRNELQEAGTRARIEGEAPLELFVGYAPGVDATWRGEAVSFAGSTRSNNTALVRLD